MNLHFRKANEEDVAIICSLAEKIWRAHYPSIISTEQIDFMLGCRYSSAAIEKGMKNNEKFFLAYADGEPVGYASYELKDDCYFLHKFYADVNKHRIGIGHQFLQYIRQQLDPSLPIRLQVNRQNYKAVNFYFKEGFTIESVGDFDIGGGYYMNDFVMLRKGDS